MPKYAARAVRCTNQRSRSKSVPLVASRTLAAAMSPARTAASLGTHTLNDGTFGPHERTTQSHCMAHRSTSQHHGGKSRRHHTRHTHSDAVHAHRPHRLHTPCAECAVADPRAGSREAGPGRFSHGRPREENAHAGVRRGGVHRPSRRLPVPAASKFLMFEGRRVTFQVPPGKQH